MPSIISGAAVASLALGIGGALAMFTLVNSVLLRPLAVDRPHELAALSTVAAAQDRRTEMFSYATFEDIRRRGLFDGVFTWTLSSVNVESESQPVPAMWVSGDAFQILGVRASIGRSLLPADDAAGGGRDGPVAMIIAGAAIVMLVAGFVSAYGPAYRASVTDPATVLRHT